MNDRRDAESAPWMRARRFPRIIALLWAFRAALAAVVAAPAAGLARRAFPSPPRGDALLWEPGAHPLLVFLTHEAHGVGALGTGAAVVLGIGAIAGIVPAAAVMVAIAHARPEGGRRPVARTVATAMARLPAFVRLAIAITVAQGLIAGAALVGARFAIDATSDAWGEARAQSFGAALAAAALPALLWLGITHDLARASIVRFRGGALSAFFAAVRAWRRAPFRLAWAWSWRAAAGIVPVAIGAWFGTLGNASSALAPFVAIALLHQATAVVRVALRVSWLAKALRSARP